MTMWAQGAWTEEMELTVQLPLLSTPILPSMGLRAVRSDILWKIKLFFLFRKLPAGETGQDSSIDCAK